MKKLGAILLVTLAVSGCQPSDDQGCDRFATMEALCQKDIESEFNKRDKQVAMLVCGESQVRGDDWLAERQAREVLCAQESSSCDVYAHCKFQIVLP